MAVDYTYRLPKPLKADEYEEELSRVLTVNECAVMFEKHYNTVMMAIMTGRLYARKRDTVEGAHNGTWLISFSSANDLWGKKPALEEVHHD